MTSLRFPSVLLPVALIGSLSAPVQAQDDFQQWTSLSGKVAVSDDVTIQNELLARFSDDRGGLYEVENSLLLGYQVTDAVAVWAGYVHNPNYSAGDFTVMEHRAREQVTIDNFAEVGRVSLSARMRLEQRWRDAIPGTGWRARSYVKLAIPLGGKTSPSLGLTAESFFNLNTTAFQAQEGLDRLRSAASLSFPVSKTVKIDAGYLNQHRFVRGGSDTDDHVLTIALGLSF